MPITLANVGPMNVPYVGPGDIAPGAFAWWGLRAYNRTTVGRRLVNLRRASDNATLDFGSLPNGDLDVSGILAWAGGSNVFLTKLYDQGSNGAVSMNQGTNSQQPQLQFNILGGKPAAFCISASINAWNEAVNMTVTFTQPWTFTTIMSRTSNFTTEMDVFNDNNNNGIGFSASTNTVFGNAGTTVTATASDNAFHAINFVANGASSNLKVDSTNNTVNAGTNTLTGVVHTIAANNSGLNLFDGYWVESGFWGGDASAVSDNQRAYWGF